MKAFNWTILKLTLGEPQKPSQPVSAAPPRAFAGDTNSFNLVQSCLQAHLCTPNLHGHPCLDLSFLQDQTTVISRGNDHGQCCSLNPEHSSETGYIPMHKSLLEECLSFTESCHSSTKSRSHGKRALQALILSNSL